MIENYSDDLCKSLRRNAMSGTERVFRSFLAIEETNSSSEDTLERLRNITKMFNTQINEDGEEQHQAPLQKVERLVPSDKIKRTFQK